MNLYEKYLYEITSRLRDNFKIYLVYLVMIKSIEMLLTHNPIALCI